MCTQVFACARNVDAVRRSLRGGCCCAIILMFPEGGICYRRLVLLHEAVKAAQRHPAVVARDSDRLKSCLDKDWDPS